MDSRLVATQNHDRTSLVAAVIDPAFSSELVAPGPNGVSAAEDLITVPASKRLEAYQDHSSPVRPSLPSGLRREHSA